MNIYVGNLPFETTEEDLVTAFSPYGAVDVARVITDRYSGRSRGFGFVEMPNDEEASKAIGELSGRDFSGRALTVNEARPRTEGGGGGRGRGDGGGGGGW